LNFLFAWRYFKAKKSTNAINIIAWISVIAMTFGTTALILVLSVFNGFEGLVKSLYSSFYTDLKILPVEGKVINLTDEQLARIRAIREIKNFSLIAEEKALLQNADNQTVVHLKGVDSNFQHITDVPQFLVRGNFDLGSVEAPLLVLGAGIENALGVEAERNIYPLVVYLPKKSDQELFDPVKNIATQNINTTGVFVIQQDFDNKYGITNLEFVKTMLNMGPEQYSAVEVALNDPDNADKVQTDLQKLLGDDYSVKSRYEQNQGLYAVMQAEKWVIYAVLVLIMIIFSFTVVSSLTMLVIEKEKDISVLHSLGATKQFIQKIFLSEGLLIGVIGGTIGMLLALGIALLQIKYHLIPLQGGSFLIDYFPVQLKVADFFLVALTILVIALLASWIPSRKAAGRQFNLRSE
jgi:lipoprotein-releasing system permease protein